jgi:two-component system phosphate regulon sensor histidine kinase PhoR
MPICVKVSCVETSADKTPGDEEQESTIQIDIIDSGSGFADSDLPYVFERLYRGDTSRYREPEASSALTPVGVSSGSGLGLAIVKQIILAHNGSIEAKNHPETGGAWLQIKLRDRGI